VARLPADKASSEPPLFVLAGGPGEAATDLLPMWIRIWPEVNGTRDIVFVDQRGTGGSYPLRCPRPIADDPARAFGHVFDIGVIAACRDAVTGKIDLHAFTTAAAVDDLDAVRQALGAEQILLYGGSYGTRLAQAYMQRHPDRVSLAVLDAVLPLTVSAVDQYSAGVESALESVLEWCAADAACRATAPNATAALTRLIARLTTGSVETTVTDFAGRRHPVAMSLGDFAYAVRGILYGARAHVDLPPMLVRASARLDLHEFAQAYWERAMRMDDAIALGLHLSVLCDEDAPAAPARSPAARTGERPALMGDYLLNEYATACRTWGVTRREGALEAPSPIGVPTLLLSGRFDPVTPPAFAEASMQFLTRARHIVTPAGAHGTARGCARDAVLHAIMNGTIEGVPDRCAG
jgi:pimeloyl-ACP methyl ester carboxylesterase